MLTRSFSLFRAPPLEQETAAAPAVVPQQKQIKDLKNEALGKAIADAKAENRPPYLTDYLQAAINLSDKARDLGVTWNGKEIANLAGMTIDGFTLREEDIKPSPEGIEKLSALMDLGGDATVSDFYREIGNIDNFKGTVFNNVNFHPASTLMLVNKAVDAQFSNVTLSGLQVGQEAVMGSGRADSKEQFNTVTFENISGGSIIINDFTIARNIHLEGASMAELRIGGRAQVNDLHAEGAHIVKLSAASGAQIVRAHFEGATIDQASNLKGSEWRNCEFSGATLNNVDFRGAQLSDVHFVGTDLTGVNFCGARLSNCSMATTDLASIKTDDTTFFHNVMVNNQRVDSVAHFVTMQKAVAIGRAMAPAIQAVGGMTTPGMTAQKVADIGAALNTAMSSGLDLSVTQQRSLALGDNAAAAMANAQQSTTQGTAVDAQAAQQVAQQAIAQQQADMAARLAAAEAARVAAELKASEAIAKLEEVTKAAQADGVITKEEAKAIALAKQEATTPAPEQQEALLAQAEQDKAKETIEAAKADGMIDAREAAELATLAAQTQSLEAEEAQALVAQAETEHGQKQEAELVQNAAPETGISELDEQFTRQAELAKLEAEKTAAKEQEQALLAKEEEKIRDRKPLSLEEMIQLAKNPELQQRFDTNLTAQQAAGAPLGHLEPQRQPQERGLIG